MPLEIERKFLVIKKQWSKVAKPDGIHYKQGYIVSDPDKSIRVRITETKSYLTIKGKTVGATREEFEYEIPRGDAEKLLQNYTHSLLEKIRYTIIHEGKVWEVDEFMGKNEGLILAEIELKIEDEKFALPEWIGKEVTSDPEYYNVNLAQNH